MQNVPKLYLVELFLSLASILVKCGIISAFTEGPLSNENMWGTYQQTYPIVIGGWLVRTV